MWATLPNHVQWNGFFVGLSTGALVNQFIEQGTQSMLLTPTETDLHSSELDTGGLSWQGELLLGVAHAWGHFYLGLQGFVNFANRNINEKSIDNIETGSGTLPQLSHAANIHLNNTEWGGDILPGIIIASQTLVHLTIGVAVNKAVLSSTNTSSNPAANIVLTHSASKRRANLRLGIGFQLALTNRTRITADYIYTDYGNINTNSSASRGTNSLANTTRFMLHSQAVMIGLIVQL